MLKSDLEKIVTDTNRKLDEGIKVFVKDNRSGDAIINGFISGVSFMVGTMAVQEIRGAYVRRKNKKWFKEQKEKES